MQLIIHYPLVKRAKCGPIHCTGYMHALGMSSGDCHIVPAFRKSEIAFVRDVYPTPWPQLSASTEASRSLRQTRQQTHHIYHVKMHAPPSKLHRFVNVSIFKTDLVTKDTGIKRQEIRTRTRAEKSGSQSNRFTFQKTIPEHWSNRTCGISRLPKILCRAATNQTVLASLCVSCPLARLVHHGALPTTGFTIQPWPAATFPFISPS